METFFMKCQILFSGKNKKIFQYVVYWKFYSELILSTSHMVTSFLYDHTKNALSGTPVPWSPSWSTVIVTEKPASVAQVDAPSYWRPGGRKLNPRRGRQHSFVEIDHEIFSTVILSLPLIQEGQLSVSGKRMRTILVNRLED